MAHWEDQTQCWTCSKRCMSPLSRGRLLPSLPSPAVNLQPQLASVTFATNNPTLTTVALEKPLCMFDSSEPLNGSYEVYLYAMVDSGKEPASLQRALDSLQGGGR